MSFFKRPTTHYGKSPEPETPYQRAAQVWDERIGSARVQAKNWRLMAFGCLFLSAGFAAALVWQSARGTIVPWVVQVDNLGQAQAVAPATADYRPTDPQVAWHLARFIEQVRSIPADAIVVRQNWLRAYEFTSDRGAAAGLLLRHDAARGAGHVPGGAAAAARPDGVPDRSRDAARALPMLRHRFLQHFHIRFQTDVQP